MKGCTVDGCESRTVARGWCRTHYSRWWRHGTTLRELQVPYCTVEGCPRKHYARGWCRIHYVRWRRHGSPATCLAGGWSEVVGYGAAHYRIRSTRGSAALHVCPCGQPATQWAYDHADPDELRDEHEQYPYSLDPAHYLALCVSCHKLFDLAEASAA